MYYMHVLSDYCLALAWGYWFIGKLVLSMLSCSETKELERWKWPRVNGDKKQYRVKHYTHIDCHKGKWQDILHCGAYLILSKAKHYFCNPHISVMWSESVGLRSRTRPVWDQKIGLGLAHCGLGLAVLVLFCETSSCNVRRHNDLEGHSNLI